MLLTALALLVAQAAAAEAPPSPEQDRLIVCLNLARTDPATAIVTAGTWLKEARDAGRAYPQQCLGQAYVGLLRWNASHDAFIAARDAALATDHALRARLGAMAGNAALAGKDYVAALVALDAAQADAAQAGDKPLAGSIDADRARALVALGRNDDAASALERGRRDAPQDAEVWLLSATLSRRTNDLETAQGQIATAAALSPDDPVIGLEAGVIAELVGNDDAARKSWQSVIALARESAEAAQAKGYLAQLGDSTK